MSITLACSIRARWATIVVDGVRDSFLLALAEGILAGVVRTHLRSSETTVTVTSEVGRTAQRSAVPLPGSGATAHSCSPRRRRRQPELTRAGRASSELRSTSTDAATTNFGF